MKIQSISATNVNHKFKVFTIYESYSGSWADEPYFQIYTLTKRVRIKLFGILILKYTSKITDKDYKFIDQHSWQKLGKSR